MTKILSNKSSVNLDYPICRPSLDLDFTQEVLDKRITFTRGSIGTRVNRNRLIETVSANQPRFDYDPVTGECKGLLIEESRQNLVTYSEDFNSWTKFLSSVATNTTISPDGNTTADNVISNGGTTSGLVRQDISGLADNTTYTFSVFLKTAGLNIVTLQFYNKANTFHGSKSLNLSTGTLTGSDFVGISSVVNYGNGWYRLILTNLGSGTGATTPNVRIVTTSIGNGTSGIYVWGAQLEQGAFPTSYIPTTASTVTRSADLASMTGTNFSSWYNQSEGTFFTSVKSSYGFTSPANASSFGIFTSSNVLVLGSYHTLASVWLFRNSTGSNNFFSAVGATTTGVRNSIASYKAGNPEYYASVVNGGGFRNITNATYLNGNLRTDSSYFELGPLRSGLSKLNGTISRLTYYPRRLKDNQLLYLTQ